MASTGVRRGWLCVSLAIGSLSGVGASLSCGSNVQVVGACTPFQVAAERAHFNVFIAMDSSGSMDGVTELGAHKWGSVTDAINTFLYDAESAGSHVGIAFFPKLIPDVPALCVNDAHCGPQGKCAPFGQCVFSEGFCKQNADCPQGDSCLVPGLCSNNSTFCKPGVSTCGSGTCQSGGYCENQVACSAEDYRIDELRTMPQQAPLILQAMANHKIEGWTPTLPALSGAVSSATVWAKAHPRDKTVVILATDGLPTWCDDAVYAGQVDQSISNVAAIANQGATRDVQTFVIGVFSPHEKSVAQTNLNVIAVAGETESAHVIATDELVAESFLDALRKVRAAAACEYAIGEPIDGEPNWQAATLSLTLPDGKTQQVGQVSSSQQCSSAGGFYYDQPPTDGAAPRRLILCPASCALDPASAILGCS